MGLLVKLANKIEVNGKKLADGASELVAKGATELTTKGATEAKEEKMSKLEKTISRAKALEMALEWNKERLEKGEQPFIPKTFSRGEKRLLIAEIKKLQDEKATKELEAFSSDMEI